MVENIRKIALAIAALLITVAVFYAATGYGLINCDDYDYLLNHPEVTGGLTLGGIRWAFANMQEAIWMPLTWISYMTDYSLGLGYGGMHWVSILIHALNAALLFFLLSRLFPKHHALLILAATLIWAIHPLRVESVVWLASRKDVISTFFFLLALLVWIPPIPNPQSQIPNPSSSLFILHSSLFILLGAAAKPSVMVFPVFAILIDLLILRRRKPWWAYVLIVLIAFGIAIEASVAQNAGGAMSATSDIPLWYRILNAVAALTIYLGNFILPLNLAPQCLLRYPDLPRFSLIGAIALLALAFWLYKLLVPVLRTISTTLKSPNPSLRPLISSLFPLPSSLIILTFFFSLIPFLGLVGFGVHAFADRFTLLPALGLSLFLLTLLPTPQSPIPNPHSLIPLLALCTFFAFRTHIQTSYWENDGRLFDHTVAVDGESNASALVTAAKYYYEFEHDLEKTRNRLARALKGRNGAKEVGYVGDLYMEAAFVAKDTADIDDCSAWLSKWDDRESERMKEQTGNFAGCHSIPYSAAEILRLASKPGLYDTATNRFEQLRRNLPRHHTVRVLAYRLAEVKGDPDEIAARRAELTDCDDDLYMRNRWAKW